MTILSDILAGIPSDVAIARRHARYLEFETRRIEDDALISGALPGDFKVVHVYRVRAPLGTQLA